MNLVALALLLGGGLAADFPVPPNLDFRTGTLAEWEGDGFSVVAESTETDPPFAVSSSERDQPGRTALLHRAIVIPPGAGVIRFRAQPVRGTDSSANEKLDVVLLASGKRILPRQVQTAKGWQPSDRLLPGLGEYLWDVSQHVGHTLRIALIDDDDRPGCHVWCSGFQMQSRNDFEGRAFSEFMVNLQRQHRLPAMTRFDNAHFIALSNAEEAFSETRLRNCELLYALFGDHFRRKGFAVREPAAKLMVAIFDSQTGFEAYLGQKMSPLVTGLYHTRTNRLVTYDFGQNHAFLAAVRENEEEGRRIDSQLDRQRFLGAVQRHAQDFRSGANIGTSMHEVAHQLSFNCGLLNHEGDVPLWLAEGLACYCEPTTNGSWQGIGAVNPGRIRALARAQAGLKPVSRLLTWRGNEDGPMMLLAYAQSWALFRMLMEERPTALRQYLSLIRPRRTPDHRLTDFQQVFGDVSALQRRHEAYVRGLVQQVQPASRATNP